MQRKSAPLSLAEALAESPAEEIGDFSPEKVEIELREIEMHEIDVVSPWLPPTPPG